MSPHAHLARSPVGFADKVWLEAVGREPSENSPWYRSHVLAQRPKLATETLIPRFLGVRFLAFPWGLPWGRSLGSDRLEFPWGQTDLRFPWGQTDLEFIVEKILNRSDPGAIWCRSCSAPRRRSPLPAGRPGPLHPGTSTSNFKSGERTIPYDRFRDRVIFPIQSARGQIVSFGGRALDPQAKAKYLDGNRSTPLFHKGRLLYGLPEARRLLACGALGRGPACRGRRLHGRDRLPARRRRGGGDDGHGADRGSDGRALAPARRADAVLRRRPRRPRGGLPRHRPRAAAAGTGDAQLQSRWRSAARIRTRCCARPAPSALESPPRRHRPPSPSCCSSASATPSRWIRLNGAPASGSGCGQGGSRHRRPRT